MNKPLSFRRAVLRFRRFTRKRYAAFASLHREVSIGHVARHICDREMLKAGRKIAVASVLAAWSLGAHTTAVASDNDSIPPNDPSLLTIEEVMVVAERCEVQSDNLRVIHRLSSARLSALPAVALSDLLDYLPEVDVRTRGTGGVQSDISIRGGTFDQVLVFLNSHNVTDPQTGHYSLDIPIDMSMIDHVEVLSGTGMSRFGLSAYSGAINIVTKTQNPPAGTRTPTVRGGAALQAGSYGVFHPSAWVQAYGMGWQLTGSASYNRSSGYISNTDYRIGDVYLNFHAANKTGVWKAQLGAQYKAAGANSFYSLAYPDQFDATKTALATLDHELTWRRWTVRTAASYRAHHDRFELFRETGQAVMPAAWYTGHNYHLTQTASASTSARYASAWGNTTAGIEVRNENILSNVLGEARTRPLGVFLYEKNRLNINCFLQQTLYWRGLSASAGVSGNWNTLSAFNWAWSANLSYLLPYSLRLYVNANQGVRLPTFTDLYYKSATQLANPHLRPERAITIEAGLRWHDEHWSAQASAWYRWGRDIIDWILLPGDEHWQARNLTAVDAVGGQVYASYSLNEWLRCLSLSYSFCSLDKQADGFLSKYALDYLRHKAAAQVEHGIWKDIGATWSLTWQQREGQYTDRHGTVCHYQPVWLFDARLYWKRESFGNNGYGKSYGKNNSNEKNNSNRKQGNEKHEYMIAIDATNLLGISYYDYGGIPQPRRTIRLTLQVTF